MSSDPAARVFAALDQLSQGQTAFGIALSGGGDSTALLHFAHGWAGGRRLMAATVDHGLRADSGAEARAAGRSAAALGIDHQILSWQRTETGGNLMAQARDARLRLLADWARANGLAAVLLGHTLDDQAETLLMRLGRGAGVDGLSAMAPQRQALGMTWLRPMLGVSRAQLREWLQARRIDWVDDPSNENCDFDRVRIRKAFPGLGLAAQGLADSAAHLAQAREALQVFADQLSAGAMTRGATLLLPQAAFAAAPFEIRRRLLVAGLRWMSAAPYSPRRESLRHALDAVAAGRQVTVQGTILAPGKDWLTFLREPALAARDIQQVTQAAMVWDNRWQLTGLSPGDTVTALGYTALAGLDWRSAGLLRDEAAASPAVLNAGRIIAAPAIQAASGITACPLRDLPQFRAFLYSH